MRFTTPPRFQPFRHASFRLSKQSRHGGSAMVMIPCYPHIPKGSWGGAFVALSRRLQPTSSHHGRPSVGMVSQTIPLLGPHPSTIVGKSATSSIFIQRNASNANVVPITVWSHATSSIRLGSWACMGCGFVVPKSKSRCPECLQRRGEPCNTLLIDQWRCVHCGNVHNAASGGGSLKKGQKSNSPLAGLEHHCNHCGKRAIAADEYTKAVEKEEVELLDAVEAVSIQESFSHTPSRFERKVADGIVNGFGVSEGKDVDGASSYMSRMSELADPDEIIVYKSDDMLWKASLEEGDTTMLRDDEIDTLFSKHSLDDDLDEKDRLFRDGQAASAGGGIKTTSSLKQAEEHGTRLKEAFVCQLERRYRKIPPAMYAAFATSLSNIVVNTYDGAIVKRGCGTLYEESDPTPSKRTKTGQMVAPLSESETKYLSSVMENTGYKPVFKAYPNCFDSRLVVVRSKWLCPMCKRTNSGGMAVCAMCKGDRPK